MSPLLCQLSYTAIVCGQGLTLYHHEKRVVKVHPKVYPCIVALPR